MIVVADTSPPLHLARIRRLDLVPAVVGRVTIPQTVWTELVQLGTRPDVLATIQGADWIDVVEDPVVQSSSGKCVTNFCKDPNVGAIVGLPGRLQQPTLTPPAPER